MDGIFVDYAGMNAAEISAWLLIATAAGVIARMIVRGKKLLGLWGDAALGLIGVFAAGSAMRALDFNLADWIAANIPALTNASLWLDIALSGLAGALILRAALRPITGKG